MNRHIGSVITGPAHNFLGLTFAAEDWEGTTSILELPAQGGCTHRPLDAELILKHAVAGVAKANAEIGTAYKLQIVEFVKNDTGPEERYAHMAYEITKEAKAEEERSAKAFRDVVKASQKSTEPAGGGNR